MDADPDQAAIIPAVSYGVSLAAKNIPVARGRSIVVLQDQFPSNVYPWRRLAAERGAEIKTVQRPADSDWTPAVLEAIDENTAVAALPNCHWTDGSLLDLVQIGERCRAAGAALVIDAIQSLGVMPFSAREVQPDFLIAGAHKWLMGPYGYGFCYVSSRFLEGTPLEENWLNRKESEDFSQLVNYRDAYQPGARRFDVGEGSNFFLAPIARAALERILEWGVDNISGALRGVTDRIAERAQELGFETAPQRTRAPHMLGLYLPDGLPANLSAILAQEKVFVSIRGNAIRVAPHLYNTPEDLDRLFMALEKAVS
ncbi:MAG: aminotransferase class V-fold PLP-dependent enzyme [Desulfobacterales bacterium]|nr:aminotransferase class V-fold PLP-dependent enzyme [Desulfobacterales bacterium]